MILSVKSGSCSIRLVCTIHASASDLSRKPGIRLHLPLRLFISTLNKCPFSGITRYAYVYHACQYGIAALALHAGPREHITMTHCQTALVYQSSSRSSLIVLDEADRSPARSMSGLFEPCLSPHMLSEGERDRHE